MLLQIPGTPVPEALSAKTPYRCRAFLPFENVPAVHLLTLHAFFKYITGCAKWQLWMRLKGLPGIPERKFLWTFGIGGTSARARYAIGTGQTTEATITEGRRTPEKARLLRENRKR